MTNFAKKICYYVEKSKDKIHQSTNDVSIFIEKEVRKMGFAKIKLIAKSTQ